MKKASAPWPFMFTTLLTAVGVLLPLVYLVIRAASVSPAELPDIVFRSRNALLLLNTLKLVAGVALGCMLVALPMAYITTRVRLWTRTAWVMLLCLPMAIPGYVGVFGYLGATGPGWLSQWLGVTIPTPTGYWGAVGMLTLFLYPYMLLNLRSALLGLDPTLEEAARGFGYGRWHIFWRVMLPHIRPALLSSSLLVALHVLGDFGVVSLLRYETFSYAIYQQYQSALDRSYAAWLSLMLLLLTVGLLWLERRMLRGTVLHKAGVGTVKPSRALNWGYATPLAYILMLIPITAGLLVPVGSVVYWSLRDQSLQQQLPNLLQALASSFQASLMAAAIGSVLAVPMAYVGVRYASKFNAALERVAYLGYATPPVAFGLSFIFFSLKGPEGLYQTLGLLVVAYVFHFLAEAVGPIRARLYQTSPKIEEAARSLGYTPLQAFWYTTFPVIRSGWVASLALLFISCAKELPLTSMLGPLGYQSLSTRIWSYTSEAMFAQGAPYALVLVVLSGVFVGVVLSREKLS